MVCIGKNIANCSKTSQFLPVMCALCPRCARAVPALCVRCAHAHSPMVKRSNPCLCNAINISLMPQV